MEKFLLPAGDRSSGDRMPGASDAMRILLIEDDENVAEVLAEAFAAGGHEIAIAHTGEDGLACLARDRPDAIVLDVRLPRLNGVGVLRQIRSVDSGLPVIIMTGLATAGELIEIRRLGVTEIIEKPELLKRFGEALARIAQRNPAQDAM
jgi:DNA-binding response OmpR family regulator